MKKIISVILALILSAAVLTVLASCGSESNDPADTGKPAEDIRKDSERDFFMSAEEAKAYHIVDDICMRRETKA